MGDRPALTSSAVPVTEAMRSKVHRNPVGALQAGLVDDQPARRRPEHPGEAGDVGFPVHPLARHKEGARHRCVDVRPGWRRRDGAGGQRSLGRRALAASFATQSVSDRLMPGPRLPSARAITRS